MNKTHYKYDELQKTIQQQSIIIPSDLDEFIQTTVKGLPFMKRRLVYMSKRIMSYMVLLLVTITLLINFNEDIAAIAAEIPGLRLIEEVNKDIAAIIAHLPGIKPSDDSVGDLGAENALDNGYSEVQELVIVQGDYTLVLNHIIIDEERISFHSRLISDKLKYEAIEVEKSDQMSTVSQHKCAYNFSLPYTGSEVITYTN